MNLLMNYDPARLDASKSETMLEQHQQLMRYNVVNAAADLVPFTLSFLFILHLLCQLRAHQQLYATEDDKYNDFAHRLLSNPDQIKSNYLGCLADIQGIWATTLGQVCP